MSRAVVFAYHQVGVRCLKVLLAHGVDIGLVVTHRDNPAEDIWFESVAALAAQHELPVITPEDVNDEACFRAIAQARPEFIFSFYFRQMLAPRLLALAPRGAFNMHGSMLPRYRGRVPVNWAVLHGERSTGATLHVMEARPDRGPIVAQQAVPILPDDTAGEVFGKVVVAAEMVLDGCLAALLAGTALLHEQDQSQASYFGGRRPEDGRIDWRVNAAALHNLVRALAPPYPGAFTDTAAGRLRLLRTMRLSTGRAATPSLPPQPGVGVFACQDALYLRAADGALLRVLAADLDGQPLSCADFIRRFGSSLAPASPDVSPIATP